MDNALLDQLDQSKLDFTPEGARAAGNLLAELAKRPLSTIDSLIRYHEALLFLRAHPHNAGILRAADRELARFHARVERARAEGSDLSAMDEPEVSGIAGSAVRAVLSHATASSLVPRYPGQVEIDWEAHDQPGRLAAALPELLPLLEEDAQVEADVPYRQWLEAATPPGSIGVATILKMIGKAEPQRRQGLYESLDLPLCWQPGDSAATRTRMRLESGPVFYQRGPLIRRKDVSLADEMARGPLPIRKLTPSEGARILEIASDTSAIRYRELHGFQYGDRRYVYQAEAGRGVRLYLCGVRPQRRLPLRAYHAALIVKNGVPVGYAEGLSLFERMEMGFNIYYTFRQGESAWIYARTLRLFQQLLGVTCFWIDPYQIGHENDEAIQAGAFWFYRKLGFRPAAASAERLAFAEEQRMEQRPGYRTPARVLRRLAETPMVYEGAGATPGDWDRFSARKLGLAAQRRMGEAFGGDAARMRRVSVKRVSRALGADVDGSLTLALSLIDGLDQWTPAEKRLVVGIIRAKAGGEESRCLRLMQNHPRLRKALLEIGSREPLRSR